MEIQKPYEIKRLVVKVGTGFLFEQKPRGKGYVFREDQMEALAEEVSRIYAEREIALVSSGAIATAAHMLKLEEIPADEHEKAQLAGEGQPQLMARYQECFRNFGRRSAQCLLCSDDIDRVKRRRNLRKTQDGWFRKGVVAIYNENDSVATDEITFGDNDILAAYLAKCIDADMLVILSNPIDGLGTGGGDSKEVARKILEKEGIALEIVNGRYETVSGIYAPKIRNVLR